MQTKETPFISKVLSSIKDFEKYPEMASKQFTIVLKYLIKLVAIFTLVVAIISTYDISKNIKNGIEYIENEITDLKFSDNKLEVYPKEVIKIENSNIVDLIIINTNDISNEEAQNYINDIEKNDTGVIFLKDRIIVNLGTGTVINSYEKIANIYHIGNLNKQTIVNYFTGTNLIMIYIGIFIMTYIYLFIAYFTSILIDSIILGTLGYITSLLLRLRIKFVAMIKIAIHSLTLPIILNLVSIILQTLFNFEIKYFEIMYITVAYIYIITAILMIKSDLIKRGQELAKIIEEEQKVREELEKEMEEKKQEEKRKKEDEDEKKKNKKDKKSDKEGNLGGEPQGGNA